MPLRGLIKKRRKSINRESMSLGGLTVWNQGDEQNTNLDIPLEDCKSSMDNFTTPMISEDKLGCNRLSRRKESRQWSFHHNEIVAHILIPFVRIVGRVQFQIKS